MLESPDRSYLTKWFVAIALLTAAVVGLLLTRSDHMYSDHMYIAPAPSGDTPVVLVGGSMTFAAKSPWKSITPLQEYSVDPQYDISKIVIKRIADDGSGDTKPNSDKFRVDVSLADAWEIDAFANIYRQDGITFDEVKVASIAPKANSTEIHLVRLDASNTAQFCDDGAGNIKFGRTAKCSEKLGFSRIELQVNGQVSASINCLDDAAKAIGKCRIVLRK